MLAIQLYLLPIDANFIEMRLPLTFKTVCVPLPDITGNVIPSALLDNIFDASDVLFNARYKAAVVLRKARLKHQTWRHKQEQRYNQRQTQEALAREIQWQRNCQSEVTKAVDAAVVWFVDSQSLINHMKEDIRQRALTLTVQAMQRASCEIDWHAVLLSHVNDALKYVMVDDNAQLYTHSSSIDSFSDYALKQNLNVQVCIDDSYIPGTGLLKTPLMEITLDARRTFNNVLDTLSSSLSVPKVLPS